MINLTYGSIFDKKCDLLIIPCNSHGGVTKWVFSNLNENHLPSPQTDIPFGSIVFKDTLSEIENAEVIGYASSVRFEGSYSSKDAIKSIGAQIYSFSKHNEVKQVNLPLLGTGAGKLSPLDSFESLKMTLGSDDDTNIVFEIFVPSKDTYSTVLSKYAEYYIPSKSLEHIDHPRVFISYAGEDSSNKDWVKQFADKLISNGVDARIDRYHMKPGTDLPQWMTNEVIKADKVLLVCDSIYQRKADIRSGGVGWETMIIQGDMLSQGDSKAKYIAIVRESEFDKALPIYMKSKLALHWIKTKEYTDEDFRALLFSLFDCDVAPELGQIPKYIIDKKLSKNKK
jgi:hypothetical protein